MPRYFVRAANADTGAEAEIAVDAMSPDLARDYVNSLGFLAGTVRVQEGAAAFRGDGIGSAVRAEAEQPAGVTAGTDGQQDTLSPEQADFVQRAMAVFEPLRQAGIQRPEPVEELGCDPRETGFLGFGKTACPRCGARQWSFVGVGILAESHFVRERAWTEMVRSEVRSSPFQWIPDSYIDTPVQRTALEQVVRRAERSWFQCARCQGVYYHDAARDYV
jgi:hypothetical protein